MGKLILIAGPNDSGKSAFAEDLIARSQGERYYIATMIPKTEENRVRIRRHRQRRAGLGFHTLEVPGRLSGLSLSPGAAVLLEDVSNLLANVQFNEHGSADAVFEDILCLAGRCEMLAAVTISGLEPEAYTDAETAGYVAGLRRLNGRLLEAADAAVEMENGVPRTVKGDIESCW